MIEKAANAGLIEGLSCHLVNKEVAILQYADDTILLIKYDYEQAGNMKFIFMSLCQMSGLKIIFYKSEFYYPDVSQERQVFLTCKYAHCQ